MVVHPYEHSEVRAASILLGFHVIGFDFDKPYIQCNVDPEITSRLEWPLTIVNQWVPERRVCVRSLYVDTYKTISIQNLANCFSNLKHLRFDHNFNQLLTVGTLPAGLTYLKFGRDFNQLLIEGVLPDSLTHLKMGNCFDQPLTAGCATRESETAKVW